MATPRALLNPILEDEGLTRGLSDPEARILVEWLVDRAEIAYQRHSSEEKARGELNRLFRRARSIARFVFLWGQEKGRPGACQLAATEKFSWPLPQTEIDPADLMQAILAHEQGR